MFTSFLNFMIFIRILASWIPREYSDNVLIRLTYEFTEPILKPVRNIINKFSGDMGMMIDFSPIITTMIILSLSEFLIGIVNYM